MTHYERIMQMNIEEAAKIIHCMFINVNWCREHQFQCETCKIDWLASEVKTDET